jgi:probable HAF family extracellular repeat protein
MNLTRILKLFCLSAVVAAALPSAALAFALPATLYRVTDLGVVPGNDSSSALAINDLGHVTGGSNLSAFFWSPQAGIVDLGVPATHNAAAGVAINNSDQIAVSTTKGPVGSFEGHAFRWTGGAYQDLGTLGGSFSTAYGIDELGRIAGYAYTPFPSAIHAFRSTTGTSLNDIDGLGGNYSLGYAMNASGEVVGQAYTAGGEYHTFYWPGSGAMQDFGLFGGTQSQADDISDNGIILGVGAAAFIWQAGVTTTISSPAFPGTRGNAVNNAGQVVGSYVNDQGFSRPLVWDAAHGSKDLNALLDPATGAGWLLLAANDINNAGKIVGQGFHDGQLRAFLLAPVPEPSTMALLGIGGGTVLLKRGRTPLTCYQRRT